MASENQQLRSRGMHLPQKQWVRQLIFIEMGSWLKSIKQYTEIDSKRFPESFYGFEICTPIFM